MLFWFKAKEQFVKWSMSNVLSSTSPPDRNSSKQCHCNLTSLVVLIENRNNVKVLNMRENPDIWHQSSKQVILAIKVQKTAKGSHTVFKENFTSDIRKLKTTVLYKDNLATGKCYKEGIDAWETVMVVNYQRSLTIVWRNQRVHHKDKCIGYTELKVSFLCQVALLLLDKAPMINGEDITWSGQICFYLQAKLCLTNIMNEVHL